MYLKTILVRTEDCYLGQRIAKYLGQRIAKAQIM